MGIRENLAAVQSVVNRLGDRAAGSRSSAVRSVFAVVDVETTGLSPRTNRVVEVAVVGIDAAGRVVDEYVTLVNPGRDVGPTRIHGIRASDVEQAPRFGDVAGHLLTRLAGRVVVGHNVAFDWRFLLAEYERLGVSVPDAPRVCTMQLARQYLDGLGSRSLAACCQAARVQLRDHHSALADARACASLLTYYRGTRRVPAAWWDQQVEQCARIPWPRVPLDQGPVSVTRANAATRAADEQLLAHLVAALPDQSTGDPDTDTGRAASRFHRYAPMTVVCSAAHRHESETAIAPDKWRYDALNAARSGRWALVNMWRIDVPVKGGLAAAHPGVGCVSHTSGVDYPRPRRVVVANKGQRVFYVAVLLCWVLAALGGILDPSYSDAGGWPGWLIIIVLSAFMIRSARLGLVIENGTVTARGLVLTRKLAADRVVKVETTAYSGMINWGGESGMFKMLRLQLHDGARNLPMVVARAGNTSRLAVQARRAIFAAADVDH